MKKIILFILFISFSIANNNIIIKKDFMDVANYINDPLLIKEANLYNTNSKEILTTGKIFTEREYLDYLYIKYPKYKKLLYVNLESNSKNLYILDVKKGDLKINQSKFVIIGSKKKDFINLLTKYFFAIFIIIIELNVLFFVFLKYSNYRYMRGICYISLTIITIIYFYMFSSIYPEFKINNLHNYILFSGLFLSSLFYYIKKNEVILIDGFIITFISYIIVNFLNYIYI